MWQNTKPQTVTKFENWNCDYTLKLKLWLHSKTHIVPKFKDLNCDINSKTLVLIKQKTKILTKLKKNLIMKKKKKFWQKVFWLEHLDTSTMDEIYSGKPFAILRCFSKIYTYIACITFDKKCIGFDKLQVKPSQRIKINKNVFFSKFVLNPNLWKPQQFQNI